MMNGIEHCRKEKMEENGFYNNRIDDADNGHDNGEYGVEMSPIMDSHNSYNNHGETKASLNVKMMDESQHSHNIRSFKVQRNFMAVLLTMAIVVILFLQSESNRITTTTNQYDERQHQHDQFSIDNYLASYTLPSWYYSTSDANNSNNHPTIQIPFIFFHQRKTGGSTLREQLRNAAVAYDLQRYIPCYDRVECSTYHTVTTLPTNFTDIPAIYGGHLYYSSFLRTLHMSHNPKPTHIQVQQQSAPEENFTCLTIFREPIQRIVSCWNYRMVQTERSNYSRSIPISQLHPEDIPSLMKYSRSKYQEGCLNEPMRIFSTVGWDENIVNNMDVPIDDDNVTYTREQQQTTMIILPNNTQYWNPQRIVDETIYRSSKCIVGILERPNDTQRVIQHFLPWLSNYVSFEQHNNTGVIEKGILSHNATKAIESVSTYEQQVYNIANQLLDKQLSWTT